MERDQLQAFNERLSQWVAGQGFWFQLRYSLAGGSYSSATFNLLFRGFLLVLVVAVVGGICLFKRVDVRGYGKVVAADIGRHINASEYQVGGFKRSGGKLGIRNLRCKGSEKAFFSSFSLSEIRCDMGLLDGLMGHWEPGSIQAGTLDMELRSGADDEEAAALAADSFLKKIPSFNMTSLNVADASLRWGFSDRNSGKIENSKLSAQRTADGWRLQFQGGRFSQNWLQQAEINKLTVLVNADGLKVEEGELVVVRDNSSSGRISFQDVSVKGGARPAVSGLLRFSHVPLSALLNDRYQGTVDGAISGDLKLSGSTYSSEGVGFAGQVDLAKDDRIVLRDRIPLLPALSAFNSYRRIELVHGSFFLKTTDGILDIRDVNLGTEKGKAEDMVTLQGRMRVRPPIRSEVQGAVGRSYQMDPAGDPSKDKEAGTDDQVEPPGFDPGYFARAGQNDVDPKTKELQSQIADSASRIMRYEGAFQLILPGDMFAHSPALRAMYPTDPVTQKVTIEVPIEGTLEEITKRQADEIRTKSRPE